jgi:hypothetical protein
MNKLQRVLEHVGHDVDRDVLEYLTKYCEQCQKYSQSPGRFKFSLKHNLDFNASIIVDVFYLDSKLVLHIVDEGTTY